jgi:hypothetical protein
MIPRKRYSKYATEYFPVLLQRDNSGTEMTYIPHDKLHTYHFRYTEFLVVASTSVCYVQDETKRCIMVLIQFTEFRFLLSI